MAEENKIEGKAQMLPVKGMSLYASSADYERRLSEDCTQAAVPGAVNEPQAETAHDRSG